MNAAQHFGAAPVAIERIGPQVTWYFTECPRMPYPHGCGCQRQRAEGGYGWTHALFPDMLRVEWAIVGCERHSREL